MIIITIAAVSALILLLAWPSLTRLVRRDTKRKRGARYFID